MSRLFHSSYHVRYNLPCPVSICFPSPHDADVRENRPDRLRDQPALGAAMYYRRMKRN